jgi:hypothetical protein
MQAEPRMEAPVLTNDASPFAEIPLEDLILEETIQGAAAIDYYCISLL